MSAQYDENTVHNHLDDTLPASKVKKISAMVRPPSNRETTEMIYYAAMVTCKEFSGLDALRQLEVIAHTFLLWAASTQRTNRLGQLAQGIIELWEEKNL